MRQSIIKIISISLIIGLNWFGFSAIGQTVAYFNDTETSQNNTMDAGRLDFALSAENDFQPEITSSQNSAKTITVQDDSTMDYYYRVRVDNLVGGLCDYLFLADDSGSEPQPLISFVSDNFLYSEKQEWNFTASLNTQIPDWQGKICQFDFVYEGWQTNMEYESGGFSDVEVISNLITNVEQKISACMKINEVYYDPGVRQNSHGTESDPNDEWIELYNSCDYEVNLKDWYLYDNNSSEHLNHNYIILPHQFVVIAANASTWTYWPDIPDNAFKIALGGTKMFNGLSNDGDVVLLYDNLGNRIDEVSWGTNTTGLNPSVPDVPEGHSISRKEKGVDTDTNADWMDTYSGSTPPGPNPGTNPHAPDGSLLLPTATQGLSAEEIGETSAPNEEIDNLFDDSASETELQNASIEDGENTDQPENIEENIDENATPEKEEDCVEEENKKSVSEIIDEMVNDIYEIDIENENTETRKHENTETMKQAQIPDDIGQENNENAETENIDPASEPIENQADEIIEDVNTENEMKVEELINGQEENIENNIGGGENLFE